MGTINAITNCIGVSSANALSLTANNGNVNLTATGSGNRVILNSEMNMSNNNIINANTITGQTALTLATLSNNNINLSPNGTGLIFANKSISLQTNSLQSVNSVFGTTGNTLSIVSLQATPTVRIAGAITMWASNTIQGAGNSISGITTLNGRNLFAYGNFYNTATQTLGAINTATRIQMNTSANNNLITLDTTTNIGRITFTNAGVYNVVWNAYLFHGSGGSAKSCIWIRLNGTDVAGSGKTENNDSQLNETNLTSSSLINATAGQYIEFFWASDHTTVPLTAVASSSPFPATPSFSCTINIVG
jgi:hypothetical protein